MKEFTTESGDAERKFIVLLTKGKGQVLLINVRQETTGQLPRLSPGCCSVTRKGGGVRTEGLFVFLGDSPTDVLGSVLSVFFPEPVKHAQSKSDE